MTGARRLPGIRFQPAPPAPAEALPRLDIPLFVGFAASGPLETPVPIEDPARFAAVFGGELDLAWDPQAHANLTAHLASAVRSFLRNGGRRCWVVRVAGRTAKANVFPVPGLLGIWEQGGARGLEPAAVSARSAGSWSDELRVGAAVDRRPVPHKAVLKDCIVFPAGARGAVEVGDLLQVTYANGLVRFEEVTAVTATQARIQLLAAFEVTSATADVAGVIAPGTIIPMGLEDWLVVRSVDGLTTESPLGWPCRAHGDLFHRMPDKDANSRTAGLVPTLERVRLELWVRDRQGGNTVQRDLPMTSGHSRFWGALKADEEAFGASSDAEPFPLAGDPEARSSGDPRWARTRTQRRRWVAGIPLGLDVMPEWFADRVQTDESAHRRDGLERMSAGIFIGSPEDKDGKPLTKSPDDRAYDRLRAATVADLPGQLDYLRYSVEPPIPLRGIYHAAGLDEVTLLSVPDAVHPGWDWVPAEPPAVQPEVGPFPLPVYVEPGFEACTPAKAEELPSKEPPAPAKTNWRWEVAAPDPPRILLDVQTAMLRLCAAQAELFAVLALPEGYRTDQAVEHANQLRLQLPSEPVAFSYGALYHPWLTSAEDDAGATIRTRPPDGAATGVIARRTLARGAWVAPANESFANVLALSPAIPREDWQALQDAQVNVIRNDPRGALCLSADTLALDSDLRPINVRRLVTVVRRAAARLGAAYVFEPNGPALWRAIRVGFEGLLGDLFRRGAFAGRTPDQGFRVTVRSDDAAGDSGRLVIELGIAPAIPMRFILVVMLRGDDGFSLAEGR